MSITRLTQPVDYSLLIAFPWATRTFSTKGLTTWDNKEWVYSPNVVEFRFILWEQPVLHMQQNEGVTHTGLSVQVMNRVFQMVNWHADGGQSELLQPFYNPPFCSLMTNGDDEEVQMSEVGSSRNVQNTTCKPDAVHRLSLSGHHAHAATESGNWGAPALLATPRGYENSMAGVVNLWHVC